MLSENLTRIGEKIKCSVAGETYYCYIPRSLPPEPPINMEKIYPLLDKANLALGRLDGLSSLLPDPALFLYMFIRKEAVLSSQIEGTQSSLSDLLWYENQKEVSFSAQDVTDISHYVGAMLHGLKRINEDFPLSLRLLREMHAILLNKGRGSAKQPGEFRRSQNWIGGSRPGNAKFVPAPPERVMELLGDLENFLHAKNIPTLIKAALAHHQFETIHPFLDGNGRLGRLLITFILCVEEVLKEPMLYLSLYFKVNRKEYYDHLQSVRETGDWEQWIIFFLQGVIDTAEQAIITAQKILQLFKKDREIIITKGKSSGLLLRVHECLQHHPITDAKHIVGECQISLPTVNKLLAYLIEQNIVKETTGKSRNKVYSYQQYLDILNEE